MNHSDEAAQASAFGFRIPKTDLSGKTLIVLLLLSSVIVPKQTLAWQGKVVGVSDGDTITVLHDGKGEKIRVYGIDCPEKGQDFGQKAKQFTSDKVFGKVVEIEPVTMDRHGRTVALVFFGGGQNLSEELVDEGCAWVFRKYCSKPRCSLWLELEERARKNKVGLWSLPNPIPPWDYRKKPGS